jgi:ubiquinone/menaquinone biosynthesis C-methylase UbiE
MAGEGNQLRKKEQPKNRINLNPISRLFEKPQRSIEPYVKSGQVVADLGCNTGHYTFALADCVGNEGMVYAVDLKEEYIRALKKKGDELEYQNIEWHAASAADLSFINDETVDFVLANGLLCNVPDHRQLVVNEIQRILKPTGQAYLSLGGVSPFFGFVGRAEWEQILEGFIVTRRGGFIQKWAAVSNKDNRQYMTENEGTSTKHPRFLKLRKKLGE